MTVSGLLSYVCQWLNSIGYKAIQAPSDNPAPAGKYISVALGNIRQHGDMLVPGPVSGSGNKKYKSIMQVAQVQLYEVEGDGEWLRDIRNRMNTDEFDTFIDGLALSTDVVDNGFRVWEIGEIIDNSSQDGAYWIRQKTMTFDVQFMDNIEVTGQTAPRMMSVEGKLNNEPFKTGVTTNG